MKMAEKNKEQKQDEKPAEQDKKVEPKAEEKVEEKKIEKKKEAIVNGLNLKISTKDSMVICSMIRGKTIEEALKMLEEVIGFKRVVKMNTREVGHKKGKGIMSGRYPIEACKEFIRLLKQLNANALVNEVETIDMRIFCKANLASRPYRSGGKQAKRTHVVLKLVEKKKDEKQKKRQKAKNKQNTKGKVRVRKP